MIIITFPLLGTTPPLVIPFRKNQKQSHYFQLCIDYFILEPSDLQSLFCSIAASRHKRSSTPIHMLRFRKPGTNPHPDLLIQDWRFLLVSKLHPQHLTYSILKNGFTTPTTSPLIQLKHKLIEVSRSLRTACFSFWPFKLAASPLITFVASCNEPHLAVIGHFV